MEERMREKITEQKLTKAVKNMGGIAPKFVSPGFDGMPDRIVLLPGGHIGFVEVKAPGEKPRPLQLARHGLLRRLGFKVYLQGSPEHRGRRFLLHRDLFRRLDGDLQLLRGQERSHDGHNEGGVSMAYSQSFNTPLVVFTSYNGDMVSDIPLLTWTRKPATALGLPSGTSNAY